MADSSTKNKLEMSVRALRAGILSQLEYRNIATLLEEEVLPLMERTGIEMRASAWHMAGQAVLPDNSIESRIAAAEKLIMWLKGE